MGTLVVVSAIPESLLIRYMVMNRTAVGNTRSHIKLMTMEIIQHPVPPKMAVTFQGIGDPWFFFLPLADGFFLGPSGPSSERPLLLDEDSSMSFKRSLGTVDLTFPLFSSTVASKGAVDDFSLAMDWLKVETKL
jgi:hypothetical protein